MKTDPEWCADRADELASRAGSVSVAGWWNRRHRADLFAEAQVYAILALRAPTLPAGQTTGEEQ